MIFTDGVNRVIQRSISRCGLWNRSTFLD